MARSSNPDQDFSAGYEKEPDLENWRATPPASLDDLYFDLAIRERIGQLIVRAMEPASGRTPSK